jgi:hypothetical protein
MTACERRAPIHWLWAIPIAWGISALLVGAECLNSAGLENFAGAARGLLCVICIAAAYYVLFRNPRVRRRSLAWLIAFLLPLQAAYAIASQLRGPAHFHPYGNTEAHHGHAHSTAERHRHAADEHAVEVETDSRSSTALPGTQSKASSALDALPAGCFIFPSIDTPSAYDRAIAGLSTQFCRQLERPPALFPPDFRPV